MTKRYMQRVVRHNSPQRQPSTFTHKTYKTCLGPVILDWKSSGDFCVLCLHITTIVKNVPVSFSTMNHFISKHSHLLCLHVFVRNMQIFGTTEFLFKVNVQNLFFGFVGGFDSFCKTWWIGVNVLLPLHWHKTSILFTSILYKDIMSLLNSTCNKWWTCWYLLIILSSFINHSFLITPVFIWNVLESTTGGSTIIG